MNKHQHLSIYLLLLALLFAGIFRPVVGVSWQFIVIAVLVITSLFEAYKGY